MAIGGVFSDTLQAITTAKLTELSNKRSTFDTRHSGIISSLQLQSDPLARVAILLEGVRHCFDLDPDSAHGSGGHAIHNQHLEDDLRRLDRFFEQAKFDPSLSGRISSEWERTLIRYLDVQSQRFKYATLYGQLVTEWLSPNKKHDIGPTTGSDMGDGFEEVPAKKRLEAREQFEDSIFSPANVSDDQIRAYLQGLFCDDVSVDDDQRSLALTDLRNDVQKFETELNKSNQFTISAVRRSITGLLQGALFAGEKRVVLQDFRNNNTILSEIADVLNMRISSLSTWSWGNDGVPVEQRRRVNGGFDLLMHEDLLQAILLQFIGVAWSVSFKSSLARFRREAGKSNFKQMPRIDRKRREYYLGQQDTSDTLARCRRRTYRKGYFIHHLLDHEDQVIEHKDGEEEAAFEELEEAAPEQAEDFSASKKKKRSKGLGMGGAKRHRKIGPTAYSDDEESDVDSDVYGTVKHPMERKKYLLHLLATEAVVNERIRGSFSAFRSVFDELQNALPHQVVLTVMEFFGVSKKWLDFFLTYLEAPLTFLEDGEAGAEPKVRHRGLPSSHALSDVFSEVVLFCLDFSVNQQTNGSFLYRLADDLWFWTHDSGKAAIAWQEVRNFATAIGVLISEAKSGSVCISENNTQDAAATDALPAGHIRWGMLYFDSNLLRFKIDQRIVDGHIAELKKQLAAKESVLDWIQAWNAYASTFFTTNFGKAANCFGREHVDDILSTHRRIQHEVFDGGDVATHVKSMISERFDLQDFAEGFLYFPVELGGLGLQSPFILPQQIRGNLAESPAKVLDDFERNEKQDYRERKADFDKGKEPTGRNRVDKPDWKPAEDADEFMSFEEYTKYRE